MSVFLVSFGAFLAIVGVVVFFLLAWFKGTSGGLNVVKVFAAEFRFTHPALMIFIGGLILILAPLVIPPESSEKVEVPTPTPTVTIVPPTATPTATPTLTATPTATLTLTATPAARGRAIQTPTAPPAPTSTPRPIGDVSGIWHSSFGGDKGYLKISKTNDFEHYVYSDSLFSEGFSLVGSGTARLEGDTLSIDNTKVEGIGRYSGGLEVDGPRMTGTVDTLTGDTISVVLTLLPDYVQTVFVSGERSGERIPVPEGSAVDAHVTLNSRFRILGEVFVEIRKDLPGSDETLMPPCDLSDQSQPQPWAGEKVFTCKFTAKQPAEANVRQWFVRVSFQIEGGIAILIYDPMKPTEREFVETF